VGRLITVRPVFNPGVRVGLKCLLVCWTCSVT
jgi:hypothetical protein